jgi:DNA polymerase III subunit delta
LIHGDDDFAVKKRARGIYESWCREMGGEDNEIVDAAASNSAEALKSLGRLREALHTLPFFGGGKVIWWQNCSFLGDDRTSTAQAVQEGVTELAHELKAFAWESVRLVISAGKADKRKSFFKAISKLGTAETLNAWSIDDRNWQAEAEMLARRKFQSLQVEISDMDLAELVANVGPHRQQLSSEIEKLALYAGERRRITSEDVRVMVSRNKQARAFALGDALGERDLPRLLATLGEELWQMQFDRQKSEIGLLYGLISKIRMMIFMKEMERERLVRPSQSYAAFKSQLERIPSEAFPEDRRFNPLAMNPYPLFRALAQTRNYTTAELVQAMNLLLTCNQQLIFSSLEGALILQQALTQIIRGHRNLPQPS